jgi:hypothetical protein
VEENPVKKSKAKTDDFTPENDAVYAVLEQVEKHCVVCPRCGGEPEGRIMSFQPEHKYCDPCRIFILDWFAMNLFLPDSYLLVKR